MKVGSSTETTSTQLARATQVLGKEEFLKLLTTQLKYQDPLEPMEDREFIAQMAQFSSLEQMFNLNDSFEANLLLSQSVNNTLATTLVGKEAKVRSSTGRLGEEGALRFEYALPVNARVTVEVVDEQGTTIYSEELGMQAKGTRTFSWDGVTSQGSRASEGTYKLKVKAVDAEGEGVSVDVFLLALVEGVSFSDGSAYLLVSGNEIPLASVAGVSLAR